MEPERRKTTPSSSETERRSSGDGTPPPDFNVAPDRSAERTRSASSPTSVPSGKAEVGKRFLAMLIDAALAYAAGLVPVIGGLLGTAYILVRDGLEFDFMRHRSIGKQVMKLRPVRLDNQPMDIETSFRRNWMFGIGVLVPLLLFIPILGWILIPFVGLAGLGLGLYEAYKVLTDDEGRRWGDRIAGTKVIETGE